MRGVAADRPDEKRKRPRQTISNKIDDTCVEMQQRNSIVNFSFAFLIIGISLGK